MACARRYNLPLGDFPPVAKYRAMLREVLYEYPIPRCIAFASIRLHALLCCRLSPLSPACCVVLCCVCGAPPDQRYIGVQAARQVHGERDGPRAHPRHPPVTAAGPPLLAAAFTTCMYRYTISNIPARDEPALPLHVCRPLRAPSPSPMFSIQTSIIGANTRYLHILSAILLAPELNHRICSNVVCC